MRLFSVSAAPRFVQTYGPTVVACPACGESNPERARFCLGCGQKLAADHVAEMRRNVTVIFADLVGSTSIGERYDAEIVRQVTGRYFEEMRAAVVRHGGTVEKFIGDAVVALFGVPRVREDDALRGVRAALDMRSAIDALNVDLDRELGVAIQARIGMNTGEVVVGEARAGGSATTGDTMNLAARLEQAAAPGEILIGDLTHRLVRDAVSVEAVEPLLVKGKAAPVVAWRLLGSTGSHRAPDRSRPPFIGRADQLGLLTDAFERATASASCALVAVVGAAGIGKSRLAEEFTATCGDATVLTGRCLSYGHGSTYWPLREAILSAIGLVGDEPELTIERALMEVVEGQPEAVGIIRRLLPLVAVASDAAVPEDVPWAIRRWLEGLARRRPVVLILDDLHWAEPGLIEVIDHVVSWSDGSAILIVGLTRPRESDEQTSWDGRTGKGTVVELAGLDGPEIKDLVNRHDLPDSVRRRLIDTADGNPLFLHQLVAMLVDEGYADFTGDPRSAAVSWVPGSPEGLDLAMPPTVSALLTSRIDRLAPAERDLIGPASVIGTVFYVDGLEAIAGQNGDNGLVTSLETLSARGFIHREPSDLSGLTAYAFDHVLIREAAYRGLTKATRAALHERLATWFESLGGRVPDEIIGHHLAAAWGCRRQLGPLTPEIRLLGVSAARRLGSASRRIELTDVAAAAELLTRAAEMLEPTDAEWSAYRLRLVDQCSDLGRLDEMRHLLSQVADLGDPRSVALAKARLCRPQMLEAGEDIGTKDQLLRRLIEEFEQTGDHEALAVCYYTLADLQNLLGMPASSADLMVEALRHGDAAGDVGLGARARGMIPIGYAFGTTPAEDAIAALDQLLAGSPYDIRLRGEIEQMTCIMHAMCGRFDRARSLLVSARRLLAEVGHELFLANFAQSSGYVEELAGDLVAATAEYARSRADLERLGAHDYLSTVVGRQARLLAERGDLAAAADALALAREVGSPNDGVTQSLILQAEALLRCADRDSAGARYALEVGQELVSALEMPDDLGELHRAGARVERSFHDPIRERAHLVSAREAFTRKGNVVRAGEAASRLAELG